MISRHMNAFGVTLANLRSVHFLYCTDILFTVHVNMKRFTMKRSFVTSKMHTVDSDAVTPEFIPPITIPKMDSGIL